MKKELLLQQFSANPPGILSEGTKLSVKETSAFVEVAGVKGIPQIGTDPERVDVTTLANKKRAYIAGLQDVDNLEFAIVYQTRNFTKIHALVEKKAQAEFQIEYPDGMIVTFKGEPSFKFSGAEVNGALEFSLVVVVSEGPTFAPVA